METSTPLNLQLYKCHQIVLEMLQQRGYQTSGYSVPTREEINEMGNVGQCEPIVVTHLQDPDMMTEVHFLVFKNTKNKELDKFLKERLNEIEANISEVVGLESDDDVSKKEEIKMLKSKRTIVIITKEEPSDNVWAVADDFFRQHRIYVQVFFIESLMFNITKHELVPLHEVVTPEEEKEIKTMFKITNKSKLHLIRHRDPPAMFIGLRPGQICRVTRSSETSGIHIVYRYCK